MPKGNMSTEGETLQVSILPYKCSICPPLVTLQMSNLAILANSKTQNGFLFPVHAMFRHDCPLAIKPASRPRRLVHKKKLGEILYLFICSFLLCLSWLLRSGLRKFRRDLWITLYIYMFIVYIFQTGFSVSSWSILKNVGMLTSLHTKYCELASCKVRWVQFKIWQANLAQLRVDLFFVFNGKWTLCSNTLV
jgi:hypothetical protein